MIVGGNMNGFQMMRLYKKNGWKLLRHGKKHDIYIHLHYEKEVPIPRHSKELNYELEKFLLSILRKVK